MTKPNNGKWAENHVQSALDYMERKHNTTFIRLYDSTSAGYSSGGSLLPGQPGDFVVQAMTVGCLLEVKSSETHLTLQDTTIRNVFRDSQILGARLWARAGAKALCVFINLPSKYMQLWDMANVVQAYYAPPRQRKLQGRPIREGYIVNEEKTADVLLAEIVLSHLKP
jgi:hypothetical protein